MISNVIEHLSTVPERIGGLAGKTLETGTWTPQRLEAVESEAVGRISSFHSLDLKYNKIPEKKGAQLGQISSQVRSLVMKLTKMWSSAKAMDPHKAELMARERATVMINGSILDSLLHHTGTPDVSLAYVRSNRESSVTPPLALLGSALPRDVRKIALTLRKFHPRTRQNPPPPSKQGKGSSPLTNPPSLLPKRPPPPPALVAPEKVLGKGALSKSSIKSKSSSTGAASQGILSESTPRQTTTSGKTTSEDVPHPATAQNGGTQRYPVTYLPIGTGPTPPGHHRDLKKLYKSVKNANGPSQKKS